MNLKTISTQQCIDELQSYATTEVRSWNPFKLFRKRRLKNHDKATHLATLLNKTPLSDADLLLIAASIKYFENSQLQQDLLYILYTKITDKQSLFLTSKANIEQIKNTLQELVNRQYKPWWTLFLINCSYYSFTFRNNLTWMIKTISNSYKPKNTGMKQYLLGVYSNEVLVNQIIKEYQVTNLAKGLDQQNELSKTLDLTLDQAMEHTQRELLREIRKSLLNEIPFGQVLISAAGLSLIINSYLSKKENKTKLKTEQAKDILHIIGTVYLKTNASQIAKSLISGTGELIGTVVSVTVAKSSINPLDTDKKIGRAVASLVGGTLGGALGTAIPFIGTYVGAYVGAVVSKTAAARFYQVLEAWQKAPRGPESIIPGYNQSYFAITDEDVKNILEPLYQNYLDTENKLKKLGDEIAQWLCIYTIVKDSNHIDSEEYFETIDEEIKRLKAEFLKLKDIHCKVLISLYAKKEDNPERVKEYKTLVKKCLMPLQQPIISMLNEYFSPTPKAAKPRKDSNESSEKICPKEKEAHGGFTRCFPFFGYKITAAKCNNKSTLINHLGYW